jgi:sporulation protein YlmC with PRC-barrel domain
MLLGRNVLDQQVIDAQGHQMGKVDGIVLELRDKAPARVAFVVVGGTTLLWRIHRGLARWAERRLGGEGNVARIPWNKVVKIGVDVKVDVEAERSPALHWERWVRDHILRRIPGA